jgi:hypothetical protein
METGDVHERPDSLAQPGRVRTFRVGSEPLRRWLGGPLLRYQVAGATVVVLFSTLLTGLSLDDFAQRLVVEQRPPILRDRLDLFDLIPSRPDLRGPMSELGTYFWWLGPDTKIDYWRPLAAVTHFVDYSLWPRMAWLMHLENLVWYAALVVACGAFYRRAISVGWVAGVATVFYALDPFHAGPVAWIANRNAIMSTLFGVLSLIAHDGWRRERRRALAFAAPALLLLALLSAEAGVAIVGYTVAYALCLDRGTRLQRLVSVAPSVLVIAAWRVVYTSLGHGVADSGIIADPFVDPWFFVKRAAQAIPVQIMSSVLSVSVDSVMNYRYALLIAAVVAIALLAVALYTLGPLLRRDETARFFAVGLAASALPLGSTIPTDRYLFWVGLGTMGLAAKTAEALADPAFGTVLRKPWAWAYGGFLLCHGVLAPVSFPFRMAGPSLVQGDVERIAGTLPSGPNADRQTVVVVNAPFDMVAGMLPIVRAAKRGPLPAHLYFLYGGTEDVRVSRTDAQTLDVRSEHGWLYDVGNRGSRASPFHIGETVILQRLRAEVRELTPDGRAEDVTFSFPIPLEDPSLTFMVWGAHGLETRTPPPVGKTMTVSGAPLFVTAALKPSVPRRAIEPD